MDYISGVDNNTGGVQDQNYYRRFNYPMNGGKIGYKCGVLEISKFERDYSNDLNAKSLTYEFINAFPKGMTSIPVQYGGADLTKVTVQFAYDRYIVK